MSAMTVVIPANNRLAIGEPYLNAAGALAAKMGVVPTNGSNLNSTTNTMSSKNYSRLGGGGGN